MVAHERLNEPCVTIDWLLAKQKSFSNLPVFLILIVQSMYYKPLAEATRRQSVDREIEKQEMLGLP